MSEHSPIPWKLAVTGYDSAGAFFLRAIEDGEPPPPGLTLTAVDANGKQLEDDFFVGDNWPRIVKCVNLHDKLVKALADLSHLVESDYVGEEGRTVREQAKDLLAKAKGEA